MTRVGVLGCGAIGTEMAMIIDRGEIDGAELVSLYDQDEKRIVEDYCEDCKTKVLRKMIGGLVDKLVGGL